MSSGQTKTSNWADTHVGLQMCCSRMAEIHVIYINSGLDDQAHKVLAFIASASSEWSDTDSTGSLLLAYSKKAQIKNTFSFFD